MTNFEFSFRSNKESNNNSNNKQEQGNSWPDENTVCEMRDTFINNLKTAVKTRVIFRNLKQCSNKNSTVPNNF